MKSSNAVRSTTPEVTNAETKPASNDAFLLTSIPDPVKAIDSGCGNPAKFLKPGENVLDLGSGAGKTTYIAAQIVGRTGRVLGIESNVENLNISKNAIQPFSRSVGYRNIEFRKGKAEDLRLNLEKLEKHLLEQPVHGHGALEKFEEYVRAERMREPLLSDNTFDTVITNNLLTVLGEVERTRALAEILRVLKSNGRLVICEITASAPVPPDVRKNDEYRRASIAGALEESAWVAALEKAGFKKISVLERADKPWHELSGIVFRAFTLVASTRPLEDMIQIKA